ncbi:MAG TPA: hypothetical protein VFI65_34060 [Streptosporangiaceae bacterium]|nr:hypothetical protein [Streptosporangiaceae bacterium]
MTLLSEAAAELYGADLDAFITRRKELAAAARKAGDAAAAKQIAALAKPTRSAWLINRLVRADPTVPGQLAEMAGRLSEMPALDAAAIRQLTVARRQLVDALVRQAAQESDGAPPSTALRDEIADTLNAALADPEVAGQIEAGALVKAAHWAGFGFGPGSGPAGGPAAGRGAGPAAASVFAPATTTKPARRAPAGPGEPERAARHKLEEAKAAAEAAAAAERDRREAVQIVEGLFADSKEKVELGERAMVAAQQELAQAQRALELAERQLGQASHRLAETRQQLSKARQDLRDAGTSARQAIAAQNRAQQALDRVTSGPSEP